MKPRIQANTKPLPKPPAPKPSSEGPRKALAAFGKPFRVVPNPKYRGPSIPGYIFVTAWKVENTDDQILRFLEAADRVLNVKTLYHGTPAKNIEDICQQGLRPGKSNCMFGRGIYMGGPEKAIGYTYNRGASSGAHYILEVEAALGLIKPCMQAEVHTQTSMLIQGFNSVGGFANRTASWGGKLRHDEYVVYDPDQVIVHRILEYHRDPKYDAWAQGITSKTQGTCELVCKRVLVREESTFADVINRGVCGKTSYTQVQTKLDVKNSKNRRVHTLWICGECINRLKLRIGSRVEAATPFGVQTSATYRLV